MLKMPFGLKRYRIVLSVAGLESKEFEIVAKSKSQAWSKFGCKFVYLKPSREDWLIEEVE